MRTCRQKYSHPHMIRSHSDKTFFFATCDNDEHYSMDASVILLYVELVTAVCHYICTLLGTTTGSWKILLESCRSRGMYFGQDSVNPFRCSVPPAVTCMWLYC